MPEEWHHWQAIRTEYSSRPLLRRPAAFSLDLMSALRLVS